MTKTKNLFEEEPEPWISFALKCHVNENIIRKEKGTEN